MNKTIITVVLLFSPLYASATLQEAASGQQGRASEDSQKHYVQGPSFVFREVEPLIRRDSRVPPMLPGFLPYVDESHPIYAVSKSITSSGYDVLLVVELPCEGENRCLYGSVRGSDMPFNHDFNHVSPEVIPVILSKGIKGGYIEANCATYCTEAYVEWRENGYYYSIGMKAGDRKDLIKMANSAIADAR